MAFCLLCEDSRNLLLPGHVGSLCPHSRTRASGWWGILGDPLLILGVNDLPCGALKTTAPSPGPLALHQDLCHLKPAQPPD